MKWGLSGEMGNWGGIDVPARGRPGEDAGRDRADLSGRARRLIRAGTPRPMRAGKVSSVPPPATELTAPPAAAATTIRARRVRSAAEVEMWRSAVDESQRE